ncbi:hypothetical protein GGI25_003071 [Coemansia spiralis]|uniref:TauD/TfdA-like domain-containing protein n=2 Tax=Coemansia TaxID=4863 RepID=A0A9W8G2N3_9FUNG|nr:hypothetical protein BX070DRAFT_229252 [Coemansia spiralis]KAJ1994581.1 hypothetical protein EDC05_001498 [Coemansia umbellata]KAJ2624387.1 hypothetical protein GGI26_001522 [Coemansia sp. RSA 1358]KAJ2677551.1 hypothetical protein GGI25_003071 [Coemansia spiralis]
MSVQIELQPDWARINFAEGNISNGIKFADFHYFWLRHNCPCLNGCRHPTTKERLIDAAIIPLEIRPLRAVVTTTAEDSDVPAVAFFWNPISTKDDTGKLVASNEKEHVSLFPLQWLRDNSYSFDRSNTHELPPHDASLVTIDYKNYAPVPGASDEISILYKAALFDRLSKYGVAVIRNRGKNTEEIIYDFIDPSADVISTHFGRIEHLRTGNTENDNNDQLGYTNAAVRLHTDQCYSDNVPGFQFLHCIRPADVGGGNYFVHAESAANYLKTEINSRAYELLTTVPVTFDRKQSKFQAQLTSPILRLSDQVDQQTNERKLEQVRYSYFTQAAQNNVPFSQLREWYEAQQVWDKLLYREDFQIQAELQEGDVVIYDNYKVLHARNGFSGPRHMAGVYLASSDLWKHLGEAKERAQELTTQ